MNRNEKIGIVTVLYNSESVIEEYFRTLNIQTYRNFMLYVIDNNSTDNSLACAFKLKDSVDFDVMILPQSENWGVAKGNNIGILKALEDDCKLVLLSNNDVKLTPNALLNLYLGMREMNASLAIPKTYFYNSTLLNSVGGDFIFYSGNFRHRGYAIEGKDKFNERAWVECAPTCFMLIDIKLFDIIGLMDETYFVYFDDTDFIYRAWKKGNLIAYIPEAVIEHKESVCTGGAKSNFTLRYYHRNLVYFAYKNFSFLHCCLVITYTYLKLQLRDRWLLKDKKQYKLIHNALKDGKKLYRERFYK